MNLLTVSVCVPCHCSHTQYLPELFDTIENQICKPNDVIVSVSEQTQPLDLDVSQYSFPVTFLVSPERKYAGENRNVCALASSSDILVFIDADDKMASTRISITKHIFTEYPYLDVLYHYFNETGAMCTETFAYTKLHPYAFSDRIHFGHPSIRRTLMVDKKYLYSSLPRAQDVELAKRIVTGTRPTIHVYADELTVYLPSRSTFWGKNAN